MFPRTARQFMASIGELLRTGAGGNAGMHVWRAGNVRHIADLSILVVSDDPGATQVLVAVIRALNVTWLTVVESHEIPEYDRYDLAILATNNRIQTALDVADRIRAHGEPPGPHIVLLALIPSEENKRALEWGRIDAVMYKPVTISGLTTQIELCMDRRNRAR
jgi:DNA-binding response OmpR family regulator